MLAYIECSACSQQNRQLLILPLATHFKIDHISVFCSFSLTENFLSLQTNAVICDRICQATVEFLAEDLAAILKQRQHLLFLQNESFQEKFIVNADSKQKSSKK